MRLQTGVTNQNQKVCGDPGISDIPDSKIRSGLTFCVDGFAPFSVSYRSPDVDTKKTPLQERRALPEHPLFRQPLDTPSHVRRDLARRANDHAPRPVAGISVRCSSSSQHFFSSSHPLNLTRSTNSRVCVFNLLYFFFHTLSQTLATMSAQVTPSKQVRDVTSRLPSETRRGRPTS
jgi:hypothetical protein